MKVSDRGRTLVTATLVVLLGCGAAFLLVSKPQAEIQNPITGAERRGQRPIHATTRSNQHLDATAADVPRTLIEATATDWEDSTRAAKHLASLIHWAAADPVACKNWLLARPAALWEKIIPEVAGSLMADSPMDAFHFLDELPPSPAVDDMLRQAAMELATRDSASVLTWADQQTDVETHEILLSAACCVQAETEPEAAAKSALNQIHDPTRRLRVLVEIAQRWVQQTPASNAAGFVGTLDGAAGPAAARVVASHWVFTDAAACGAWILTLPPAASLEAFRPFLDHQILHNRSGLVALLPTVMDPELSKMLQTALDGAP